MRRLLCSVFVLVAASLAGEALACPNCATARFVRASVFDVRFWVSLALISLPLLVLAVISALLYQIGSKEDSTKSRAVKKETRV